MKREYAEIIEALDETEVLDLDIEHINSIETGLDYETKRDNAIKMGKVFAFGAFFSAALFAPIGIIFAFISLLYVIMVKKKYNDKGVFHLVVTCLSFVAAIVNVVCLFGYINHQEELSEARMADVLDLDASNNINVETEKDPKIRLTNHLLELKYSTSNGTYFTYNLSLTGNTMYRSFDLEKANFKTYSAIDDLTMSFDYSYVEGTVVYTYIKNKESSYIYYRPSTDTYDCQSAIEGFCDKEALDFVNNQIKDGLKKFDEILAGANVTLNDLKK